MWQRDAYADGAAVREHLFRPAGATGGGPYPGDARNDAALVPPVQRWSARFAHVFRYGTRVRLPSPTKGQSLRETVVSLVRAYRSVSAALDRKGVSLKQEMERLRSDDGLTFDLVRSLAEDWARIKDKPWYEGTVIGAVRTSLDAEIRRWWYQTQELERDVDCPYASEGIYLDPAGRWNVGLRCEKAGNRPVCNVREVLGELQLAPGAPAASSVAQDILRLQQEWPNATTRAQLCQRLAPVLLAARLPDGAIAHTGARKSLWAVLESLGKDPKRTCCSRRYPRERSVSPDLATVRFWTQTPRGYWLGDGRLSNVSLSGAEVTLDAPLTIKGTVRPPEFVAGNPIWLVFLRREVEKGSVLRGTVAWVGDGVRKGKCGLRYVELNEARLRTLYSLFRPVHEAAIAGE